MGQSISTISDKQYQPYSCQRCYDKHLRCDKISSGCSSCLNSKCKCVYIDRRRLRKKTNIARKIHKQNVM